MAGPAAGQAPEWRFRGDWFDVCKCNIPCPCEFAQPPTYGDCEGILAYHIREGHYGEVRLDGLNLNRAGHVRGQSVGWRSQGAEARVLSR